MDSIKEPTRFAWMRDGELVAGTLHDWANMWEGDYYAGDNDLTHDLLTWDGKSDPVRHLVSVQRGKQDEDDWVPYTITVPGLHDQVARRIDGRA